MNPLLGSNGNRHRSPRAWSVFATLSLGLAASSCAGPSHDQAAGSPKSPASGVVAPMPSPTIAAQSAQLPATIAVPPNSNDRVPTGSQLPVDTQPSRLVIDRIAVDVPLARLGLTDDGALQVPTDPQDVGWWRSQRRASPTVIVGHVDSKTGPAVFFQLDELRKGDTVTVHYREPKGSSVASFLVRDLERVGKDSFPSERVYRGAADELRLVTCGGRFNRKTGHYVDNVIVYATPITS